MRLPTDLRIALDRLAASERRSLASYVEGILADHVAALELKEARLRADIEARKIDHQIKTDWASRPARPHPKPGR